VKTFAFKIVFWGALTGALCASCAPSATSVSSSSSEESLASLPTDFSYAIGTNDASKGSVGYEVFVGSYADSNGDRIGDLAGLTSKLDYLSTLGVHRLWLTPIFPSPTYHKYDATDYYSIDSALGTLKDFDALMSAAHYKGMEVILDLVMNHSSSQHPWFTASMNDFLSNNTAADSKKDWYSWSSSQKDGYQKYADGAYCEARFDKGMPEFNLATPAVVSEFENVAKFWISDHAVDGFRLDAVKYYFYEQTAPNIAYLSAFRQYCESLKKEVYIVGENWSDQSSINEYAAAGIHLFNFPTSENQLSGPCYLLGSKSEFPDYFAKVSRVQSGLSGVEPCYFITNHDQDRWGGYLSGTANPEYARKVLAASYLLTPGTPWMYYGEELEMRGTGSDPCKRTGMIWGGDESTCLGETSKGALGPDSQNSATPSVAASLGKGSSFLNFERAILALRNRHNDLFQKGTYTGLESGDASVAVGQIVYGTEKAYLLHNKKQAVLTISLPSGALAIQEDVKTAGIASALNGTSIALAPFDTVLLG
jgi:alpha-amylase